MSTVAQAINFFSEAPAAYHERDAVSFHRCEDFIRSPREFWAYWIAKIAKPERDSDSLDLGTGTHAWVLEPDRFEDHVALIPNEVLSKNGARNNNRFREWAKENVGKAQLKEAAWEKIKRMRRAILEHPIAGELIRNATLREFTFTWSCERTDIGRKARIDVVSEYQGRRVIADLKSTQNHTPRAFARRALELGYHRQAAHYLDAYAACMTDEKPRFANVVVNVNPPHLVRVYEIEGDELALGYCQVDAALEEMARRFVSDYWSEEGEDQMRGIQFPAYAFEKFA